MEEKKLNEEEIKKKQKDGELTLKKKNSNQNKGAYKTKRRKKTELYWH